MRSPFENIRSARAVKSEKEMARKAQTPADETPDALRAAMKEARLNRLRTDPNTPTVPEMRTKYGKLFDDFTQMTQGVDIAAQMAEGDQGKIAEGRIAFLERVEYVEQIQQMLTPELVAEVGKSEYIAVNDKLPFRQLIGNLGIDQTTEIIKGQLLNMACTNSTLFENLAKSVEFLSIHKQTDSHVLTERDLDRVMKKYNITSSGFDDVKEEVERANDTLTSPEERQDAENALHARVQRSKLFGGIFRKMTDAKLNKFERRAEAWQTELEEKQEKLGALETDMAELEQAVDGWRRTAEKVQNQPNHMFHQTLRTYERLLEEGRESVGRVSDEIAAAHEALGVVERGIKRLEKKSSKPEVERLKEVLPNAEEALEKVDEYMTKIEQTLTAVLDGDPGIRAEVTKEYAKKQEQVLEIDAASATAREWGAQKYVAEQRFGGSGDTARSLEQSYRKSHSDGGSLSGMFSSWLSQNFRSFR